MYLLNLVPHEKSHFELLFCIENTDKIAVVFLDTIGIYCPKMKKGVVDFLLTSLVCFTVVLEFIVAWGNSVY